MKSTLTILITMVALLFASCTKNEFSEKDALEAQKELLQLKYQHEIDLETLKQKGATAMQELLNQAALEQLRLNDSLTSARTKDSKKQDYSIMVVDVLTNAPVEEADVTVSSDGKVITAKTNAQGIATFSSLILYPTSAFLVSKTGYAASQVLQQYLTQGPVKLWNSANLSNEIYGNLYIDTDLTTPLPENVGPNILVTAGTVVPTGTFGSYTVYFPTYTKEDGSYSLKIPAAVNPYNLTFQQIVADQKLFVNAVDGDAASTFPSSLPRMTTIKTYFNVNDFNVPIPDLTSPFYFKLAPDINGKVNYIPGSNYYNNVFLSAVGDKFQVERLNVQNGVGQGYSYRPNSVIDVEIVDITGFTIQTAPKLMALTDANGSLMFYSSTEGGYGYIHLKRDTKGALVSGAKGVILKAVLYDGYQQLYWMGNQQLNFSYNFGVSTSISSTTKGDKRVVNFYYGAGSSREKNVY